MNNQLINDQPKKYNLEERTAKLGEDIIDLVKKLPRTPYNNQFISQITRSSGSIAANYYEATEAESRKDFIHKIGICKKETKETKLWIRLLIKANPEFDFELRAHNREVEELLLIFSASITTAKNKK